MTSLLNLAELNRALWATNVPKPDLLIETVDNPGWVVSASIGGARDMILADEGDPEHDVKWLDCRIRSARFYGHGGPHQLVAILSVVANAVDQHWTAEKGTLETLAEWYASRCDGDWEHQGGVSLRPSLLGWELILYLNGGYWPEPQYPSVADAIFSQSDRQVRIEGTTRQVNSFLGRLQPLDKLLQDRANSGP